MVFHLSPRKRLSRRMKILVFFLAALLLGLVFVLPVQGYVILGLFSPIILAIIFIDLNRPLHAEKA